MTVQFTNKGLAELLSAKNRGFKAEITHIAAGDRSYKPHEDQVALINEKQRVEIADYEQLTATQLRMGAKFSGTLEYEVREIGFFLETGTLLAVYSIPNTLLTYKSANSTWVQKFTLDISPLPSESITINVGSENLNILLANELAVLSTAQIDSMTRELQLKERVDLMEKQLLPVGVPIPWPSATPPKGFLKCDGASFDKFIYPMLATAYPSGKLPDLRGEFIRGWDDGRGIDAGRLLLSSQGDAIRNITGHFNSMYGNASEHGLKDSTGGAFSFQFLTQAMFTTTRGISDDFVNVKFNAAQIVPTAEENRPRNIAFLYIVRAA